MPSRVALRFDWHTVTLPMYAALASGGRPRFYVANPTPEMALNAWRSGSAWRWGILAFVDGTVLVYRDGHAPTMREAKLRAEQAIPASAEPPQLWDRPDETNAVPDEYPSDLLPF